MLTIQSMYSIFFGNKQIVFRRDIEVSKFSKWYFSIFEVFL